MTSEIKNNRPAIEIITDNGSTIKNIVIQTAFTVMKGIECLKVTNPNNFPVFARYRSSTFFVKSGKNKNFPLNEADKGDGEIFLRVSDQML